MPSLYVFTPLFCFVDLQPDPPPGLGAIFELCILVYLYIRVRTVFSKIYCFVRYS